jgi:hypothetical protein
MDPLDRDGSQRRVGILPLVVCSAGSKRYRYDEPVTENSEASSGMWQMECVVLRTESKIWLALTRQPSHEALM